MASSTAACSVSSRLLYPTSSWWYCSRAAVQPQLAQPRRQRVVLGDASCRRRPRRRGSCSGRTRSVPTVPSSPGHAPRARRSGGARRSPAPPSSMTARPCFRAIGRIRSIAAIWPKRCTTTMARVRGVIAASMAAGRDVEGGRVDVHEHRRAAGVVDGAGRGEERERRGDDLVARLQVERPERQEQRVGAAGAGDGVPGVATARRPPARAAATSGPMMKACRSMTERTAGTTSSRIELYWATRSSSGTFIGTSRAYRQGPSRCIATLRRCLGRTWLSFDKS